MSDGCDHVLRIIWPGGVVRYGGRKFKSHRLAKFARQNGGRETCSVIEYHGDSITVIPWGSGTKINAYRTGAPQ